jgi:hypothetical protein
MEQPPLVRVKAILSRTGRRFPSTGHDYGPRCLLPCHAPPGQLMTAASLDSVIHCGHMLPGAHRGRMVAVTVALPGRRAVYR